MQQLQQFFNRKHVRITLVADLAVSFALSVVYYAILLLWTHGEDAPQGFGAMILLSFAHLFVFPVVLNAILIPALAKIKTSKEVIVPTIILNTPISYAISLAIGISLFVLIMAFCVVLLAASIAAEDPQVFMEMSH